MRMSLVPLLTAVACGASFAQAAPVLLQPVDPMPLAAMPAELDRALSAQSTAMELSDLELDIVTAGQVQLPIEAMANFVITFPPIGLPSTIFGPLVLGPGGTCPNCNDEQRRLFTGGGRRILLPVLGPGT